MTTDKNHFQFNYFDELSKGDVFKFSPVLDSDIPSKFFTVIEKNEVNTKFAETYGKEYNVRQFANETPKEIMIFPNRKR